MEPLYMPYPYHPRTQLRSWATTLPFPSVDIHSLPFITKNFQDQHMLGPWIRFFTYETDLPLYVYHHYLAIMDYITLLHSA